MLFEKVGIMLFMIILLYILSYNYLKKYAPENSAIIVFLVASFVLYITFAIYDIFIPIYAQILILLFGILIPCVIVFLQSRNIIIAKKIIYYKMKSLYNIKDYKSTLKYINKLVILDGRSNELLYLTGMCYKGLNDFINSRDSFALALEFDDKDYKSYYEYGLVLDSTNKKEAALLMFDKAIKCKPDFYEAKEAKGICLTSQGRFLEAIFSYNEAVKMHKDAYEMYYNIGMLEQEVENYDKAEEAFRKVEEIKPEFLLASYNIGELCLRKGEYEEAIKEYKKVTNSMTYGPKSYYKIAVCYALLQEYDKAMSALEYTIELNEEFIKKAAVEYAFLPMRDMVNSYIKSKQEAKQREIDKKNYMKNKIISFFKKDGDGKVEKFKIAK